MTKVFVYDITTGKFKDKDLKLNPPGNSQILVEQKAIGLNEIDIPRGGDNSSLRQNGSGISQEAINSRDCTNPDNELSLHTARDVILGHEGCGIVKAIGKNVKYFSVGDRVAYISQNAGTFRSSVVIDEELAIKIPDYIEDLNLVSAIFLKACIAHTLTARAFIVREGTYVAINNASHITNQIIHQFIKHRNGKVINIISDPDEYNDILKIGGSDGVIFKNPKHSADKSGEKGNISEEILKLSNGHGVHAFIDTADSTLLETAGDFLCEFGVFVIRANSSYIPYVQSKVNLVDTEYNLNLSYNTIARKSLFLTIPSVFHYKNSRHEMVLTGIEIFEMMKNRALNSKYKIYKLDDLNDAMQDLKSGKYSNTALVITL